MWKLIVHYKMKAWFSFVIIYSVTSIVHNQRLFTKRSAHCPSEFCRCLKDTAKCTGNGRKLSFIPRLPLNIKKLKLDSDYFPWITRKRLEPIIPNNITSLSIKSSNIHQVSPDAFKDLIYLVTLDLSTNIKLDVNSLKHSLSSLVNDRINTLVFKDMHWTMGDLNVSLFAHLNRREIKILRLNGNKVNVITERALVGLEKLDKLDISGNILTECDTSLLYLSSLTNIFLNCNKIKECKIERLPPSLTTLSLENNRLTSVPSFCWKNGTTILSKLVHLRLDFNDIHVINKSSFDCLLSIKYLSMKQNNVKNLPPWVFSGLKSLRHLYFDNMKTKVYTIGENAFNIPSLKKLSFFGNAFRFDTPAFARRASLSNCTQLEFLDISYNHMTKWEFDTSYLLQGLTNLKHFIARQVYWNVLPNGLFKILPNIEKLDLSSNAVKSMNDSLFDVDSTIKRAILVANLITHIGPKTFPSLFWKRIEKIDLSGNPFVCDCNLLWFRDMLKTSSYLFSQYPNEYRCQSPSKYKKQKLIKFNLTEEKCLVKTELTTALITSGSVFIFIFILVLIVYNGRWHIRYWIYSLRNKKAKYNVLRNEGSKYDAFIIYSDNDGGFVHNILLHRLEKEEGFRMCVHFRDFQVGKIIVDNIVECMSESRLVIVVLSKHFFKSEWCKFELLMAQDRLFRYKSEALLPVLLEEVDSSRMTKNIHALLQATTYCKWSDNDVGQRLFWEQIINTLNN